MGGGGRKGIFSLFSEDEASIGYPARG